MDNTNIIDNDLRTITVMGEGPVLPAPQEMGQGSMKGQLFTSDDQPVAGAIIEICVERLGSRFTGETPCDGQTFVKSTTTDESGIFVLSDLPRGYYILTISPEPGQWAQLTTGSGFVSERVPIVAGEETDLGEIKPREE
jgi:hypothetical protein